MNATFFHKEFPAPPNGTGFVSPAPVGAKFEVAIKAVTDTGVVILDDEDGDTHTVDPTAGATAKDRVRIAVQHLVSDIAGRRGLSVAYTDVSEVAAP